MHFHNVYSFVLKYFYTFASVKFLIFAIMDKQKIFRIKIIDVLQDDVVESYHSCDINELVSLLNDFEGYPRRMIINSVEFRDVKVFNDGRIIRF